MKTVAIVGYGFMGRIHAACWRRVRGGTSWFHDERNSGGLAASFYSPGALIVVR